MDKLADYPPPIQGLHGQINRSPITNSTRVICYTQATYDDDLLEGDEFFGLGLIVQTGMNDINITVDPAFSHTKFTIIDNEGKWQMIVALLM